MQAGLFIALLTIQRPLRIVVAGAAVMVVAGGLLIAAANLRPVRDAVVEVADVPWLGSGEVNQASSEYYRIALLTGVLNRLSGPRWLYGFGPGTFQNAGVQVTYAGDQHVLTAADSQYVEGAPRAGPHGSGGLLPVSGGGRVARVAGWCGGAGVTVVGWPWRRPAR